MKKMMNLQRLEEVRKNLDNLVSIATLVGPLGLDHIVAKELERFGTARLEVFPEPVRKPTPPEPVRHNHVTRDIKRPGKCPACDEYHAKHPVVKQPKPSEIPTPYRKLPPATAYNPERYVSFKVLWAKVIIRAAYDFALWKESKDMRLRKFADDAARWLFEPSNLELSFENICFAFDFPIERIRTRTKALTKQDVKKLEFRERHGRVEAPVEELTGGDDE